MSTPVAKRWAFTEIGRQSQSRSRRRLRRPLEDVFLLSPTDSGYGSSESSPYSSPCPKHAGLPSFDGSGSTDSTEASDDTRPLLARSSTEEKRTRARSSSAPSPPTTEWNTDGASGDVKRPGLERVNSRYTDRFVPVRDHDSPIAERFQASKPVEALSPAEKIVRNITASHDPFLSRRRAAHELPSPTTTTGMMEGRTIHGGELAANIAKIVSHHNSSAIVLGPNAVNTGDGRQVSQGTVWAVGGVAPGTSITDDGQGHLLRSSTNARVFSTTFSSAKPSVEEDLEKYQGRVASALDIDRVRKILDFDGHGTFPRCTSKKLASETAKRTTWTGSSWVDPAGPERQ